MPHPRGVVLLALMVLALVAPPTHGIEVLELTGGSISFGAFANIGQVNITGPRLAITGIQILVNDGYSFRCTVPGFGSNCTPGTTLQAGGFGVGGDFPAVVTLDGIPHTAGSADITSDSIALFISTAVLIPDFGSIASAVLAAHFEAGGTLGRAGVNCFPSPFNCDGNPLTTPGTTYELHGQGTFFGALHRATNPFVGDYWQSDSGLFLFQPTPEPATFLLVATSVLGAVCARRWRRL